MSLHCTHTQTERFRHAWMCLSTVGIGIHSNIRIDSYTLSLTAYILLLLVSARTDILACFGMRLPILYFYLKYSGWLLLVSAETGVLHCFGLRLLTVFLFQVFRMASLVRASLEFNMRYYRPKTIFAIFKF